MRHYAAALSIQVDTDFFVSRCDLPKVGVLLQPCWGLGHAITTPSAQLQQSTHISCHANMFIKASQVAKDLGPWPNYKTQTY
jgi:hypothetical protein